MLAPHQVPERADLELDRRIAFRLQAARRFLSGKKIAQQRASPTKSPMRSLGGFPQGVAPNKLARREARGVKYAVTSLASLRANTAMSEGWPLAMNNGRNISWMRRDGAEAATPFPSALQCQVSMPKRPC
jgi:hypothetical protein